MHLDTVYQNSIREAVSELGNKAKVRSNRLRSRRLRSLKESDLGDSDSDTIRENVRRLRRRRRLAEARRNREEKNLCESCLNEGTEQKVEYDDIYG